MTTEPEIRRFQFSLASLLVVQTLVAFALGIWKGFGWPVMLAIVAVGTMFSVAVLGTVWIAGDWGRSTHLARVAAKAIVLVALVTAAFAALECLREWFF